MEFSIFHYTTFDILKRILLEGFKFSKLVENINMDTTQPDSYSRIVVQAVCFCELPLRLVEDHKEHMQWYGKCALGLSLNWAIKNSISPVIYTHEKSSVPNLIRKIYQNAQNINIFEDFSITKTRSNDIFFDSIFISQYLKQLKGPQTNKFTGKKELKEFYKEREWRAVNIFNSKHIHVPLKFSSQDIDQLFFEDNNQADALHKFIVDKKLFNVDKDPSILRKIIDLNSLKKII